MLRGTCLSRGYFLVRHLECQRCKWRNLATVTSGWGLAESVGRQCPLESAVTQHQPIPGADHHQICMDPCRHVPPNRRATSISEGLSRVPLLPIQRSLCTFAHVQHPSNLKSTPFYGESLGSRQCIDCSHSTCGSRFCFPVSSFSFRQSDEWNPPSLHLPSGFGNKDNLPPVSCPSKLGWGSRFRHATPLPPLHCGHPYVTRVAPTDSSCRGLGTTTPYKGDEDTARDRSFGRVDVNDIEFFTNTLGSSGVLTDKALLDAANTDWMRRYKGWGQVLLKPRTVDEVSAILKHCHARRLAIVPQGGNTGMVGGGVPVFDEVIVNMGFVNRVLSFDEVSGILICEAGCILGELDSYLAGKGHTMPWDFGSKRTCQIGGNISTNAGGIRFLRYGSLHASVLGLEAVLADGTVLDMMSEVRKDNTGYDIKQLFIGAEGTLGVVTKAAILTARRPSSVHVAFLACNSFEDVKLAFSAARKELGEILSAFEVLDRQSIDLVLKHIEETSDPLPDCRQPFYILIETSGSNEDHDKLKMKAFVEDAKRSGLFVDGLLAQDKKQMAALWRIREGVGHALQHAGPHYKYDLSTPITHFYELVYEMRARLKGEVTAVLGFGHLGDGNLHLNFVVPKYDEKIVSKIEPFIFEWIAARRGSISAEHGLGRMKAEAITYSKPENVVKLMGRMKGLFDPHGILNPYKVLPKWARNAF